MSEPKFTPGPWEVKPEEVGRSYIRIRGTRLGARFKIANVIHPDHEGTTDSEAEETRANSNLIAAAPDLYLVLNYVLDVLVPHGEWAADSKRMIDAALAKARGEG